MNKSKISRTLVVLSMVVTLGAFLPLSESIAIADTPANGAFDGIAGATTIDAEHLIELYQSQQQVTLIDSRLGEDRRFGYIESSISLPLAKTSCASLDRLVADKSQPIAFYCNGTKADASIVAASIAVDCGYSQLYWFRGGFKEWEDKDYPFVIE